MKRLTDLRCKVAIGNDEFIDTSILVHLYYEDEELIGKELNFIYTDFNELYEAVKDDKILNAKTDYTFWRSKPAVKISLADEDFCRTISAKTMKKVSVKWVYEDVKKEYTMKDLASMLSAENFCEYLKDRGITKF